MSSLLAPQTATERNGHGAVGRLLVVHKQVFAAVDLYTHTHRCLPDKASTLSDSATNSMLEAHTRCILLEAGLRPLLERVVGALTDSRGVGDSSW